jgi:hypothetical protein
MAFAGEVKVVFTMGTVKAKSGAKTRAIKKGEVLSNADQIITGSGSFCVIKIDKHTVMRVEEETTLAIKSVEKPDQEEKNSVIVESGGVLVNVFKSLFGGQTEVKTRSAAFAVRGTKFQTQVENGETWLAVNEGTVEATSGKAQEDYVGAGEGIVVDKNKSFTKPKKYGWLKKINWQIEDKKGKYLAGNFGKIRSARRKEFLKKREKWINDPKRREKLNKLRNKWKAKIKQRRQKLRASRGKVEQRRQRIKKKAILKKSKRKSLKDKLNKFRRR